MQPRHIEINRQKYLGGREDIIKTSSRFDSRIRYLGILLPASGCPNLACSIGIIIKVIPANAKYNDTPVRKCSIGANAIIIHAPYGDTWRLRVMKHMLPSSFVWLYNLLYKEIPAPHDLSLALAHCFGLRCYPNVPNLIWGRDITPVRIPVHMRNTLCTIIVVGVKLIHLNGD